MQNFSMDPSVRESGAERAFHATLKRIVAGSRAAVVHRLFSPDRVVVSVVRRARSNALLLVAYCRYLPLIYRQSLAKVAECSVRSVSSASYSRPSGLFVHIRSEYEARLCAKHLRCER